MCIRDSYFPDLRDGLAIPTFSLTAAYLFTLVFIGGIWDNDVLPSPASAPVQVGRSRRLTPNGRPKPISQPTLADRVMSLAFGLSMVGCVVLFGLSVGAEPPKRLPDLWPVLVSAYSAVHFGVYLGFGLVRQMTDLTDNIFDVDMKKKKQN